MSANLNVPRAVALQGEFAEKLISTLNEQNAPTGDVPDNPINQEIEDPDKKLPDKEKNTNTPTDPPLAPSDANEPTPVDLPQENTPEYWQNIAQNWEHKYAALAGKYNTEIEQQKHLFYSAKPEIDQLRVEKDKLEQTVRELQLQLVDKSKEAPKPTTLQSPEIKELLNGLKEEYGEELVNGFMTIISAVDASAASTATQLEAMNTTVENVRQTASATTQQQSQQIYMQKIAQLTQVLAQSGIDFKRVDDDPLFHEWLSKYDQITGKQRQSILMGLFEANELNSVAGMYAQYIQESGAVYSNLNASSLPKDEKPNLPDLNEQVQVEPKAPVNQELPLDKKIWTNQSIAQFYQDVAKGKYSKEKAASIEKEIFSQLSE